MLISISLSTYVATRFQASKQLMLTYTNLLVMLCMNKLDASYFNSNCIKVRINLIVDTVYENLLQMRIILLIVYVNNVSIQIVGFFG